MSKLLSISPLTGRYRDKIQELEEFTSEYALIKTRIEVEIKYLISLSKIRVVRKISKKEADKLDSIYENFDLEEAEKIKEIEETTKHDVKAVEIYLGKIFRNSSLKDLAESIHFGLTSEDINNIAFRIMLRSASKEVIIPTIERLSKVLSQHSQVYKYVPMLARTHGQPAVPTTLGKEIAVFASRLNIELKKLKEIKLTGKLNGAVGNYNALFLAFPKVDWLKFSKSFISGLDLEPNLLTTQINAFEDIIEYFQTIQRINGVLLDLNQDFWRYISDGWLVQSSEKGQVGSSTMPQKINPIDFENSEGNLELANGIIEVFTRKLPISRLQRDLSNSTIIRNIGTVLGYSLLAYKSAFTGVLKVKANEEKILEELNSDWSILAEALQTILRTEKVKGSYFKVLEETKGKKMDKDDWKNLILKLPFSKNSKQKLLKLTPKKYIGLASKLTY